jgi:hydroxyacylglutathione hydrolase
MLRYLVIPVTPFQQNATLLWCDATLQGALLDPGGEVERLLTAAADQGVRITSILLTHGHIDHVGGCAEAAARTGAPILGPHPDDRFLIEALEEQGRAFRFAHSGAFMPDRWLRQGDEVQIGQEVLEVLHCPGHTPGHIVFFLRAGRLALVGDVLFRGSIGRTDFPRGDYATLIDSIRGKLWPLGDEVTFIPGHGPNSTFGRERRDNPFVGDDA